MSEHREAVELSQVDQDVRGVLTMMIAELGRAPPRAELAQRLGLSEGEVVNCLRRLHEAHALLLHPHCMEPWVVHPFALSPGSCWVQTPRIGYWANCLYCAFGIVAALEADATIHTRLGGEMEPVVYQVTQAGPQPTDQVFHLSIPVRAWWDNVIHSCATFQPFRRIEDIDPWCRRHGLPKGAVLAIPALWSFAKDWYGPYLTSPWRKRDASEARALFAKHGLDSDFWSV